MEHHEERFQGFGGANLFYQCWRPETKPRGILGIVHGFGEHSGRYMNVVDYFVPRTYAVYGFDHRGHGRSPGQRGHINCWEEYRGDIAKFVPLMTRQESGAAIFLWAHSMGALIGLDYILHYPQGSSGAIISGAPIEPIGVGKPYQIGVARLLSGLWPTFVLNLELPPSTLSRNPAVAKAYIEDPLVHGRTSTRWGTESMATLEWVKARAAKVMVPILLIHGERDALNRASGTRRFFEQVTFADKEMKIYPGGYHEPHNDLEYERVLADVEQWLERHI